ncbi:MAG: hypothetical protein ABJR46_11475 [Tateyamaria sp.]|uniref:DUF7684 family protein n=1 Tax=Tateyamaria sp. TaxID=1929288 RepID=UPI0032A038B0
MRRASPSAFKMFRYIFAPTDIPVSIPTELTKFKCLILIEREVSEEHQWEVSKALIKAGCLYSLAWGIDCYSWDESVDYACMEHYDYGDIPDEEYVMTTWHETDTLEETIEFAKNCTQNSDVKLEDILVLDFVKKERETLIEGIYLKA